MVGAFYFYNARESGTPTWLAFTLALLLGGAIGVAIHLLIMRPLRRAPALSRLIATLGLFTAFYALRAEPLRRQHPDHHEAHRADRGGGAARHQHRARPASCCSSSASRSRSCSRSCTTTPASASRRPRWRRAGAPPPRRASRPTASPRSTGRSARCSACSRAILIVNLSGLQVITLTLLIVPALAAALVGSFKSFWLTLFGGLLDRHPRSRRSPTCRCGSGPTPICRVGRRRCRSSSSSWCSSSAGARCRCAARPPSARPRSAPAGRSGNSRSPRSDRRRRRCVIVRLHATTC